MEITIADHEDSFREAMEECRREIRSNKYVDKDVRWRNSNRLAAAYGCLYLLRIIETDGWVNSEDIAWVVNQSAADTIEDCSGGRRKK